MGRPPLSMPLRVYLNGRLVGHLRRESSGATDFQYDREWLSWSNAIPVSLSLPLREDRYIGASVLAVLENLLPDNDDIRRRVAERSQAGGADAFNLLAAIGRDCVGALQFLPANVAPTPAGVIDARPLSDAEIAALLRGLGRNPLGIGADREFRISLAGAQEKTALLYWNDQWHIPHGTTATTHILKPQIGKLPNGIDLTNSVENEHFCLELVGALGLPVAKSSIIDFAGARALAVERFDRTWTRDGRLLRIPQEDFCQALSVAPSRKYESDGGPGIRQVMEFLKGSDAPESDQRIFFETQIVFWLLGGTDGHAKNFSIRLAPGGRFRLTPLYDIISAQPSLDAGDITRNRMKLAMAIGTDRHYVVHTVAGRHFLQTAEACGLPRAMVQEMIAEIVGRAAESIERVRVAVAGKVPEAVASSIANGVKRRLRALTSSKRE